MFKNPAVSVVILAYKHEKFIADCINSAVNQVTKFAVEILIGVDHCSDKTHEICLDLQQAYPGKIRVVLNDVENICIARGKRVGQANFNNVLSKATGKYIAICDGDDYWSDPLKLQKQVDILEEHPDSIACHHWHSYAFPDDDGIYHVTEAPTHDKGYFPAEVATVKDVFANQLRLKSRTLMFRNLNEPLPDFFNDVAFGDVALSMILGMRGNFRFIDEPMAVYRQTGTGASTVGSQSKKFILDHNLDWIDLWERGDLFTGGQFRDETIKTITGFYKIIIRHYKYRASVFIKCLYNCIVCSNLPILPRFRIAKALIRIFSEKYA